MGLSERKSKQRLVGSATSRNTSWATDASLPGQRLLAGMGWSAGQGLGTSSNKGSAMSVSMGVKFKMDNSGIGVDRAEKDARAAAKAAGGAAALDPWATQGAKDFGSLLERLSAANQAEKSANSTPKQASSSSSSSSSSEAEEEDESERPRKKAKKEGKSSKSGSSKTKESKKSKGKARSLEDPSADEGETPATSKRARKEARQLEKAAKKAAKAAAKGDVKGAEKAAGEVADAIGAGVKADESAIKAVEQAIPGRLAHRARYLRAKRAVSSSGIAHLNEILGIAPSASASASSSKAASPAPPPVVRTALGPGGAEIPVMMKTPPMEEASDNAKAGDDSGEEKKRVKSGKRKEKGDDSSESKEKKKKKDKESKKRKRESPPPPADSQTPSKIAPASDPSLDPSQNNLTISRLGVFEYLSNRLIVRKAAVLRAQKRKQDTVWDRVSAIGA